MYTNTLGLNALVFEVCELLPARLCIDNLSPNQGIRPTDGKSFSTVLHQQGGPPVGSFEELAHMLLPVYDRLPRACLFDVTHDNVMPAQKVWSLTLVYFLIITFTADFLGQFSALHYVPMAALCSMVASSIGSTRGFDELAVVNVGQLEGGFDCFFPILTFAAPTATRRQQHHALPHLGRRREKERRAAR